MKHKKSFTTIPPGGQPAGSIAGNPDSSCNCGVSESQFPYADRCFRKGDATLGIGYEALCPYCGIWTSLPEGAALTVTRIFDCSAWGYGKRISEEGP